MVRYRPSVERVIDGGVGNAGAQVRGDVGEAFLLHIDDGLLCGRTPVLFWKIESSVMSDRWISIQIDCGALQEEAWRDPTS